MEYDFEIGENGKLTKLRVLDHGFVRLVDSMGSDLAVVQAARVSYAARDKAGQEPGSDDKLLRFLWKNKHTSPFEAVTLKFEVKAPIFIFRQWHRHRTWSYNELSARYRELPEDYYIPSPRHIGQQAAKNKQAREIVELTAEEHNQRANECDGLENHCMKAFSLYRSLLSLGWPRELARSCLPVNTYSHMEATVNLLNLLRFLTLRCDSHAQWEMQEYANALKELARTVVPTTIAAWEEK